MDHRSDGREWRQRPAGAGATFPRHGIDLPDIAFGAQTTLAYSENATGTGGTLTVSDGRHAAAIALLGNYMAGSFVAAADGHGGTLVTQAQQTGAAAAADASTGVTHGGLTANATVDHLRGDVGS